VFLIVGEIILLAKSLTKKPHHRYKDIKHQNTGLKFIQVLKGNDWNNTISKELEAPINEKHN